MHSSGVRRHSPSVVVPCRHSFSCVLLFYDFNVGPFYSFALFPKYTWQITGQMGRPRRRCRCPLLPPFEEKWIWVERRERSPFCSCFQIGCWPIGLKKQLNSWDFSTDYFAGNCNFVVCLSANKLTQSDTDWLTGWQCTLRRCVCWLIRMVTQTEKGNKSIVNSTSILDLDSAESFFPNVQYSWN